MSTPTSVRQLTNIQLVAMAKLCQSLVETLALIALAGILLIVWWWALIGMSAATFFAWSLSLGLTSLFSLALWIDSGSYEEELTRRGFY